jgi:hypothetical protein
MRCLVLDVDALCHASGLRLLPLVESLIDRLPDKAYIERSVYTECIRSGLTNVLNGWQQRGLLREPVDYRKCTEGEGRFRALREKRWRSLSRQDCASLVLARSLTLPSVLTCESLLTEAARYHGILSTDLVDVLRFALRDGYATTALAIQLTATWDTDPHSAGRPTDYRRTFTEEAAFRDGAKPLPVIG